ncbi:ParB/RepB/Spo0J family partition protein [Salinibaculum rarum]|uniref:ParB/RepB/Spo0J family partition protein n=1 Tax=Salinibaculum rarum TaxID=3058903 RepID=UPI00265DDE0E|nr:ParB/RepB/Spo0J family partition protein [Salinibaculum sp. KK48]
MAQNPFWDAVEDDMRGERVRVTTPNGAYTGILAVINYNQDQLLLRDATTPDGDAATVTISSDYQLELLADDTNVDLRTVDVASIRASPYSVREYDSPEFDAFVRQVRENRWVAKPPLVRPLTADTTAAEYEIVSGNKRLAALQRAGIDEQLVRVRSFDAWEAGAYFIDEHFPLTDAEFTNIEDDYAGWYTVEQMRAAYERLRDEWSREELLSHPAIERNIALLTAPDDADLSEITDTLTPVCSDSEEDSAEQTPETVIAGLVEETERDEDTVRDDVETLCEFDVPLGSIKGSLRRKYAE